MTEWKWQRFTVTTSRILKVGRDGNIRNAERTVEDGPTVRYRWCPTSPRNKTDGRDWVFLERISGVWYCWWQWKMSGGWTYIPMPHAHTLKEAQATALAMRRLACLTDG